MHISKLLSQPLTQPQQRTENSKPLDSQLDSRRKKIVNHLFAKMSSIFGTKWANNFPTAEVEMMAKREWYDALDGLTPVQLRTAVDRVRQECEWPPSIAEFLKYTKTEQRDPCHRMLDALPPPKGDPEVARKALEIIRSGRLPSREEALKTLAST